MKKLSKAQLRNLDRLKQVGAVTYTTRRVYKRSRYGNFFKLTGPLEKANKKGFHLTALGSLVELGLVVIVIDMPRRDIGDGLGSERSGSGYENVWTYKPAPVSGLEEYGGPTEAVCRTCDMEFFGGGVVPDEGYECERCKSERGEA